MLHKTRRSTCSGERWARASAIRPWRNPTTTKGIGHSKLSTIPRTGKTLPDANNPTATTLASRASVVAALSVEALLGTEVAFAAPYQLARPHPGQIGVAAELRHLLRGSGLECPACVGVN